MVTTAFVNIWNKRVGAIAWNPDTGIGSFEFDKTFLSENLELSPLKMSIENAAGRIFSFPELRNNATFRGLPGLLADVLPDKYGNAIINTWLTRHGRASNSLNPVEMLCFIGEIGMGALEFEPVQPKSNHTASKVEIGNLIEVAEGILSGRKTFESKLSDKYEKGLLDILKIGTSAGGARAKAIIAYNPKTNEVRSGQADAPKGFSHWLIKFDGVSDTQFGATHGYGRVEMAYHLMTKDAEIEMTECKLFEENGRAHFMTKRFDRADGNKKIHTQTFCALQHYDFNEINLFSYEQLFETMRLLRLSYPQAEQLFRRMVFNVMSRNCDDHTKNFSFIMNEKGEWRLSPAYDMCHAYRPGSDWVSQHGLSINGKRKDISKADLRSIAKQMNIKKADAIISQISSVVNGWRNYAEEVKVNSQLRDAIQKTLLPL